VAAVIYLDTHVVAWLYAGRSDLLSTHARRLLETEVLLVSPTVVLELQYLFELERVADPAVAVTGALERDLGLRLCDLPFEKVVSGALDVPWTRDPFDRLIVSQAELRRAPLVTKDRSILDHYARAIWDG
jgi:PIN domain nuclease of toxin-antitoxin system